MSLISGLDLGFIKDEGFRKFVVVVILMIGLIVFGVKGLVPINDVITWLFEIAAIYAGYNIGSRWLSQLATKKTPPEVKP